MVSKKDVNDIGIGMLIGAVGLLALPFIFSDNLGGANQHYMVQFFPRGDGPYPEELNFILSDGTMGVVEADAMIPALIKDPMVGPSLSESIRQMSPQEKEIINRGEPNRNPLRDPAIFNLDTALMYFIMNGANIGISKALFDNLKSWANKPYMGL